MSDYLRVLRHNGITWPDTMPRPGDTYKAGERHPYGGPRPRRWQYGPVRLNVRLSDEEKAVRASFTKTTTISDWARLLLQRLTGRRA